MVLSREAREEFEQMAGRGRMGVPHPQPRLTLLATQRAERGYPVAVRWSVSAGARAQLCVTGPDGAERVLSERMRGALSFDDLEPGTYRFRLRATPHRSLGPRARGSVLTSETEIFAPAPSAQLRAPGEVEAGMPLRVRWSTEHAADVWLAIGAFRQRVQPVGQLEHVADTTGPLELVLTAHGEGGEAEERLVANVTLPALCIRVAQRIDTPIGESAFIDFEVRGARPASVRLLQPERGEPPLALPMRGRVEVPEVFDEERFVLEAVGIDGTHAAHAINVIPAVVEVGIDEELEFLHQQGRSSW